MSKINPLYEKGDVKFFYNEHLKRMRLLGKEPVTYVAFYYRLRRGVMLKEAIYTPSNRNMARYNMKPKPTWKEKLNNIRIRFISFFN